MADRIDARCTVCGATFPREEATTDTENELSCPACGCSVIRGIPDQHTRLTQRDNARCDACGATFPRSETTTETKGELACPICGANDVRSLGRPAEHE
jgi:DNA-directed RNA polymerase subunit RPC12/RpoP